MYLVDTNIFLEILLEQENAEEVARFFRETPSDELHLSEFSFYTLGVVLLRRKRPDLFLRFVNDIYPGVTLLRLGAEDMGSVIEHAKTERLDFDDAYQYAVAEKYNLTLVSFDKDFDRTKRGRKLPNDILKK